MLLNANDKKLPCRAVPMIRNGGELVHGRACVIHMLIGISKATSCSQSVVPPSSTALSGHFLVFVFLAPDVTRNAPLSGQAANTTPSAVQRVSLRSAETHIVLSSSLLNTKLPLAVTQYGPNPSCSPGPTGFLLFASRNSSIERVLTIPLGLPPKFVCVTSVSFMTAAYSTSPCVSVAYLPDLRSISTTAVLPFGLSPLGEQRT